MKSHIARIAIKIYPFLDHFLNGIYPEILLGRNIKFWRIRIYSKPYVVRIPLGSTDLGFICDQVLSVFPIKIYQKHH